jgi:hypothetical protein
MIAVFLCTVLSGCNRLSNSYTTEKNKFIGTWVYLYPSGTGSNYSFTYTFFSNGTFRFNKTGLLSNGTYDIIDGDLFLSTIINGKQDYVDCTYAFSENNTILTINGTPYNKQ